MGLLMLRASGGTDKEGGACYWFRLIQEICGWFPKNS